MQLFYSPSRSLHKVPIVAREKGVWDRIEVVAVYPYRAGYDLGALNPLAKVPTLVQDDGTALYGSQAICEFLDALAPAPRLFPEAGPKRWDALRRMALADTVFETAVQIALENNRPPAERRPDFYTRQWPKILRGFDEMERDIGLHQDWDIGRVATLHPCSYVDVARTHKDPLHTNYDWRPGHPRLAAWFAEACTKPSVAEQLRVDPPADDSPEACQRGIQAALAKRRR